MSTSLRYSCSCDVWLLTQLSSEENSTSSRFWAIELVDASVVTPVEKRSNAFSNVDRAEDEPPEEEEEEDEDDMEIGGGEVGGWNPCPHREIHPNVW
jgi:hypothetical protein